jgi:VIT1/CCC1 family predicted Fe2+/Mn2+ transporter
VASIAAVVGGAISMALGEYVSVSSQRDSQRALVEIERRELADAPEAELAELAGLYMAKGLSLETAQRVAEELTEHDALAAHLSTELNIDQDEPANPWQAAHASAAAFTAGAILPLPAILLPPAFFRVPVTFLAVLVALALTGTLSAGIGGSSKSTSATRLVIGGGLALAATYGIGTALGASGVL